MIQLDRVIAMLVTSIVVLMGFTVQQRAQQSSLNSTMLYVGKKQTLELADMLERDLTNVGFGTTPSETAITTYTLHADGVLDRFEYLGSDAGSNQIEIRYDVVVVDTADVDGVAKPLYELQRYEKTTGAWVRNGGSTASLTNFTIDLLDDNNNVVVKELARRIRLRLENVVFPEINTGNYMDGFRRLHWGMTLSPPNLRGYQGG